MNHKWKITLKDRFGVVKICLKCKLEKSYFSSSLIDYYYNTMLIGTYHSSDNISIRYKMPSCDELIIKSILE